jgi:hypothetical protein
VKKAADEGQILATVSQKLMAEYGKGFDIPNLGYIRLFYETYTGDRKVSPLVTQLPWTHNLVILRQTKRELKQQFCQSLFERIIMHPPKVAPAARQIHCEATIGVFKYMPMCRSYRAFPILNAPRSELSWAVCRMDSERRNCVDDVDTKVEKT